MQIGGLYETAKELRVRRWIDPEGGERATPLRLADLGPGYKIIFCFQHWCPGCHSRGFPTLQRLHQALAGKGTGFAAIQTVFEGAAANTYDKVREDQLQYGLPIPFGHDAPIEGERYPSFMEDYRTGGTPWFTVIDPKGIVAFADFRLDAERFLQALDAENLELMY